MLDELEKLLSVALLSDHETAHKALLEMDKIIKVAKQAHQDELLAQEQELDEFYTEKGVCKSCGLDVCICK